MLERHFAVGLASATADRRGRDWGQQMKLASLAAGASALALLALAMPAAAASTVVVPDPGVPFILFGSGDASVTYNSVTFSQSSVFSNGNFFNVGPQFSGDPAVVSSQEQSVGEANILISLPAFSRSVSLDYGTFGGSTVEIQLSTGAVFLEGSTGSGYATPDVFSVSSPFKFDWVLLTSHDSVLNVHSVSWAVPEPATWAMMLIGFGALGAAARTRRSRAAAAA